MLNLFLVLDAVIVIPLITLSVMVLLNGGHKSKRNISVALFSLLIAIWIPANHIGNDIRTPSELAQIANYFVFACSFGAMILVMQFAVHLAGIKKITKLVDVSSPLLFILFLLSATPLMGAGVEKQDSIYAVVFGPLLIPYGVALVYMITLTLIALFLGIKRTRGIRNNQLQVIGASLGVALPLVLLLSFILPSTTGIFWFTEFGILPLSIIVIGLYYSIIRHKLFDIRLVVMRGVVYASVLTTLSVAYYVLAYIVSVAIFGGASTDTVSMSPINIVLALVLTIMFQPVKAYFDRVTNKYFYRERYNSDDFFARLSSLLVLTNDLRGLLERVSREIAETLKAEQVFFFLYHSSSHNRHITSGTPHHTRIPTDDAVSLDEYASRSKDALIIAETLPRSSPVRRLLTSHQIAIAIPLRGPDQIVGYIMLGEHRSGTYTKRDYNLLVTTSNELVVAIQNALSLQEVKELNATLQQRIDVATKELRSSNAQLKHLDEVKDEFISMASHQLRTPLTSVKGYISMVLDGDAGKVTPQQQKLLSEAFNSSERMVHLIADFLNVSRLQTGRFAIEKAVIDLKKVVAREVENLEGMASSRGMKLKFESKSKEVIVRADESKLREVIMNYIDNAIYYSQTGTTITVSLDIVGEACELRVKDTGIGVPKDEQSRLFNKFFRATNARKQRPDGTGVGLYLARRVITGHGGTIIFESTEGKGSTFGFRLPTKLHQQDR